MKRFLLLLVVLAACLVTGCIGVETYKDTGQGIGIDVNQQFVIALSSNWTTGYSWQASYDETMLELVGGKSTYKEESNEGLLGGGGVEHFRFKALKSGSTEIVLTYKQPGEGGGIVETKEFAINIR